MTRDQLQVGSDAYDYYDINVFAAEEGLDIRKLPVALKILLENLLRNMDSPAVDRDDARALASWTPRNVPNRDIAYHPARVVMQDFTGVPAVVDSTRPHTR